MASVTPASGPKIPAASGYRMPAEWERHAATWIAWPHERGDWPGKFAAIPWVYAEIVRLLALSEPVNILVPPDDADGVRRILRRTGVSERRASCWPVPTDRVWTRDSGPIFVTDGAGKLAANDFQFNAWAKYDNHQRDDALPATICGLLGVPRWQPQQNGRRVVLEGGSIDVNGTGLLLTTEECLLGDVQVRNPGFTRDGYEAVFRDYLGVDRTIWLGQGIVGDDTHGHVDDIARFVTATTVLACVESSKGDENYQPLQDNLRRLREAKLDVVTLPMPAPVVFRNQRLPASYANFYIANDRVLMPTFNDPRDRTALGILADLFPGRQVIGVHAVDLVWGLGTLHCLTQQQPAGELK